MTLSTGPSEDSERQEQDDFVDGLIENIADLPQPGTPAAKVLALGIRMRPTLGPVGQQIADVFDPPPADPNLPPQAQAAIQQLQAIAPKLSQQAQNEINHESVLVLTKDPRKAARWAPVDEKPTQSDATREAIGLFATLLIAAPGSVPPPQNNYIDQIEVLLPLLAGKIAQYTKRNNMATQDEAMGLGNALQYIGQAVQALGQDPAQKQRVKKYTDDLAKLGNEVKALTQRGEQAAQAQAKQAQAGQNGEAAAKMKADQAMTAQKIHHKEIEFNADQARKDRAARAEQRRKDADTYASIEHDRFGAMAGAHNARFKSMQETPE